MQSVWGKNTGKWASYQIQQNQNRAVYADHVIQQERISQGCQTINKSNNVASVNSGSIATALMEGSQDYTCTEKAECLLRAACPASSVPPPTPPPAPPSPVPGEATLANLIATASPTESGFIQNILGVTTDLQGNVFICGYISNSATTNIPIYDYSTTTGGQISLNQSLTVLPLNLVSISQGAYLVKYDKNGVAQWAVNFDGTNSATNGASIVTDTSGNVYFITDYNTGSALTLKHMVGGNRVTYGNIPAVTSPAITSDIVLVKYNSNGTIQAVSACRSAFSGANEKIQVLGVSISYDPMGYVVFTFSSTTTSTQSVTITNSGTLSGGNISFATFTTITNVTNSSEMAIIVKAFASNLDPFVTTKITGADLTGVGGFLGSVAPNSICLDSSGNIICACTFTINGGSGRPILIRLYDNINNVWGTHQPNASGSNSSFIVKYDMNLTPLSFTIINNNNSTLSTSAQFIITDSSGNIYVLVNAVTSTFNTTRIFSYSSGGGGGSTINVSLYGTYGIGLQTNVFFLVKYNSNLAVIPNGVTIVNYNDSDILFFGSGINGGLTIDNNNNVYIALNYTDKYLINNAQIITPPPTPPVTISVIPYGNIINISPFSTLNNNILLIKYDSSLQAQWATSLNPGINLSCTAFGLRYDYLTNSVYVVGQFDNRGGGLNINNFGNVSGGTVNTSFYAKLVPNAINVSAQSGFIVKYNA